MGFHCSECIALTPLPAAAMHSFEEQRHSSWSRNCSVSVMTGPRVPGKAGLPHLYHVWGPHNPLINWHWRQRKWRMKILYLELIIFNLHSAISQYAWWNLYCLWFSLPGFLLNAVSFLYYRTWPVFYPLQFSEPTPQYDFFFLYSKQSFTYLLSY